VPTLKGAAVEKFNPQVETPDQRTAIEDDVLELSTEDLALVGGGDTPVILNSMVHRF
jgi:hypothetical protein